MKISKLFLKNFRNYQDLTVEFDPGVNILVGLNAQGKTNILEALYYCAMGKSHRASFDEEMILWRQERASIEVFFSRHGATNSLRFHLREKQKKEIWMNDSPFAAKEVIGSLNVVLFSPEDLWLIKGAPALRRRFLDNEISQANRPYYKLLSQYNRLLMQRNNLLKKIREKKVSADQLEQWDEQLAPTAARIVWSRWQSVQKMTMLANLIHRRITDSRENLSLRYLLTGGENLVKFDVPELESWYRQIFRSARMEDIARGSTSIGPHRDDILFYVSGKNLRVYGSQGQQRTGVLSLKLAELEYIKSETGEYPILLLDDVMSELDFSRRLELMSFIREKVQTFITATDEIYFPDVKSVRYFRVLSGTLTEKTG